MLVLALFLVLRILSATGFNPEELTSLALRMADLDNGEWMSLPIKQLERKVVWMKHVHWVHSLGHISSISLTAAIALFDSEMYAFATDYLLHGAKLSFDSDLDLVKYLEQNQHIVTREMLKGFGVRKSQIGLAIIKSRSGPLSSKLTDLFKIGLEMVEIQDMMIKSAGCTDLEGPGKIRSGLSVTSLIDKMQGLLEFPFCFERVSEHLTQVLESNFDALMNVVDCQRYTFSSTHKLPLALYIGALSPDTDGKAQFDTILYARTLVANASRLFKSGKYHLHPELAEISLNSYRLTGDDFRLRLNGLYLPTSDLKIAALEYCFKFYQTRGFNLLKLMYLHKFVQKSWGVIRVISSIMSAFPKASLSRKISCLHVMVMIISHNIVNSRGGLFPLVSGIYPTSLSPSLEHLGQWQKIADIYDNFLEEHWVNDDSFMFMSHSVGLLHLIVVTLKQLIEEHGEHPCSSTQETAFTKSIFSQYQMVHRFLDFGFASGIRKDDAKEFDRYIYVTIESCSRISHGLMTYEELRNGDPSLCAFVVQSAEILKAIKDYDPSISVAAVAAQEHLERSDTESSPSGIREQDLPKVPAEKEPVAEFSEPQPETSSITISFDVNEAAAPRIQAVEAAKSRKNQIKAISRPHHQSTSVAKIKKDVAEIRRDVEEIQKDVEDSQSDILMTANTSSSSSLTSEDSGEPQVGNTSLPSISTNFMNHMIHFDDIDMVDECDVRDILYAYLIIGNKIYVKYLSPFMNYLEGWNFNFRQSWDKSPSLFFQEVRLLAAHEEDLVDEAMRAANIPNFNFLWKCIGFYERRLSVAHSMFPSSFALRAFKGFVAMLFHSRHSSLGTGKDALTAMRLVDPAKPKNIPKLQSGAAFESSEFIISLLAIYEFCAANSKTNPYKFASLSPVSELRNQVAHMLPESQAHLDAAGQHKYSKAGLWLKVALEEHVICPNFSVNSCPPVSTAPVGKMRIIVLVLVFKILASTCFNPDELTSLAFQMATLGVRIG